MPVINYGQNPIKKIRKNLDLTQEQFADELGEKLNRNLTKKDICRWEKCEHRPNREVLVAIAQIGNVDIPNFISAVKDHFEKTDKLLGRSRKYATHY